MYPVFTFQHVTDRLVVLQRFAAQLELQEKQLKKRNSQLESQNESLKRERAALRDTLRKVYTHTCARACTHEHMQTYTCLQIFGPKNSASGGLDDRKASSHR